MPKGEEIQCVHYDNGVVFCDAEDQDGLLTIDESEVTCPACLKRLRRIDRMVPRAKIGLHRVDWFGEDGDGG